MSINSFDEIPDLVCYFSGDPNECTIVKSGDIVTSVTSTLGSQAVQLTQATAGSNNITHDGTTTVGLVPAFISPAKSDAGLVGTMSELTSNVGTLAVLEQRSVTNDFGYSVLTNKTAGAEAGIQSNTSVYRSYIDSGNRAWTPTVDINADANIIIMRWDEIEANGAATFNGAASTFSGRGRGGITGIKLFNDEAGSTQMVGNIAIALLYDRRLNDTEVAELNTLMAYWRDNGESPGSGPTPVAFGPVTTNDDPSVTGWQWEESSNGTDWANVGTILTDFSGATTNILTINTATPAMNQTLVRCRAYSANEPAGVVSNSATLTVT